MNGTSKYPIGSHQWHFIQSECVDEGKKYRSLNFHKYVKEPGNFCCKDGACFPSKYVNDGIQHCESGEDESDYPLLEVPKYHDKFNPLTEVNVSLFIVDIFSINEADSTFDVYFSMTVIWRDETIKFQYLKNNKAANILSENEKRNVWFPNFNFDFVRESFTVPDHKIFIVKTGTPKLSGGIDELDLREIYDGHANPLMYKSEHNMRFFCSFDGIGQYPFETEICSFYFFLNGPANNITNIKSKLEAPANKIIGKYLLSGWEVKYNDTYPRSSKKMVKVSVSLRREPVSIIMVTYLPTILMNIINQATNYITGDSKYDLIITVNITSMMVLISIYLSVSTSLPSTPNIKPVEVWLLFNLAYPFLVIVTNVFAEVTENRQI